MRVAQVDDAVHYMPETVHRRGAVPEKAGQRARVPPTVGREQPRHQPPVLPVDVLAPAHDLADEALHCGERRQTIVIRVLDAAHHRQRVEQAEVHGRREQRMKEYGAAPAHRILVGAEVCQPVTQKVVERGLGFLPRHSQVEARYAPDAARQRRHLRHHLLRDRVRRKRALRRDRQPGARQRLAILAVEIPGAAKRFALRIEQQPQCLRCAR
jgi:hypothetical protein